MSLSTPRSILVDRSCDHGLVGTIGPLGPPSDASAQQRPDCANFLDPEDAQVALDADPKDPFGLDGNNDGEACGSLRVTSALPPLANCDDLRDHPRIALALYDHSLTKYGSDRYDLAGCIEQASTGTRPAARNGGNRGGQATTRKCSTESHPHPRQHG